MNLIPGKEYYYWSKGVFESRASKKICILVILKTGKKWAVVRRPDLEVRQIQIVLASRLKELPISKVKLSNQLTLPLGDKK